MQDAAKHTCHERMFNFASLPAKNNEGCMKSCVRIKLGSRSQSTGNLT